MTRRELETKLFRLRGELVTVMDGGNGSHAILVEFAAGLGTGYAAYAKAKETLEALIADARKELAALPQPSKFEKAKQEFYDDWGSAAAEMGSLGTYIDALEACRPWVIKSKSTDAFAIHSATRKVVLFATKEDACEYNERTGGYGWKVVQWEGSE